MQQAVLEFDEAVQVPWRPPLSSVAPVGRVPRPSAGRRGARPDPLRVALAPSVPVVGGPSAGGGATRAVRAVAGPRPQVVDDARPVTARAAARPGPARRSRGSAPVRLTRRGRRLLIGVCLAVGVALGAWAGPAVGQGSGDLRLVGDSRVVVQPGDTLWSIATAVAGGDDVRAVVYRIRQLNHLRDASLRPGQVLQLP